MVVSLEKSSPVIGETERVIEEFKQKVIQSLDKERSKLKEIAEQDAKIIRAKAYQESANVASKAREDSIQIIEKAKEQANREVDNILLQAQQRAEQFVKNAEEITRKEAKERTRKEVDNLIRNAKEEANKLVAKILQTGRDEASEIIGNAKKEAALLVQQMTFEAESDIEVRIKDVEGLKQQASEELASAQKKAQAKIEQILITARAEAKEKADKEAADIIIQVKARAQKERELLLASTLADAKKAADTETEKIILKAKLDADQIINEAKNKVRIQLEESSTLMIEIQQKMQQVIGTAGLDMKKPEPKVEAVLPKVFNPKPNPVTVRDVISSHAEIKTPEPPPIQDKESSAAETAQAKINSIFGDEGNRTYQGRLKIDIAPPVDGEQIAYLEQSLSRTGNLRLVGKGGAEDGSAWVEIDITRPIPLLDILRNIPSVKDVVGAKSYIIVALKANQLV